MSIYLPYGNFPEEVIDPEELSREWVSAKTIADNTSHWQFTTHKHGNRLSENVVSNGAAVKIVQKTANTRMGAGRWGSKYHHDANDLKSANHSTDTDPWLFPYMEGWKNIFHKKLELEWTSEHSELVMFGFSYFSYRLSSKTAVAHSKGGYFDGGTFPRVKVAISVNGSVIEGTGPGCNVPVGAADAVRGSGSNVKGFKSVSNCILMLPAGEHTIVPVGMQSLATNIGAKDPRNVDPIDYFPSGTMESSNSPDFGVAIVSANFHALRFPRGTYIGS